MIEHIHIDKALADRVVKAMIGLAVLSPEDIRRLWLEIEYLADELRKARKAHDVALEYWLNRIQPE